MTTPPFPSPSNGSAGGSAAGAASAQTASGPNAGGMTGSSAISNALPIKARSRWFTFAIRAGLAGLFGFSAYMKLQDPQAVVAGVKAFKVLPDDPRMDHLVVLSTFLVPWLEAVLAAALLLGFWTRSAALALFALLASFTAAIYSVLARGIDADCSCFGTIKLLCPAKISECHLIRNSVLMALALWVVVRGSGPLAADGLFGPRPRS